MSRKKNLLVVLLSFLIFVSLSLQVQAKKDPVKLKKDSLKSSIFSGLKFRNIGPAFTSGRIADFAVNPDNSSEYYVAAAAGHVWKTTNNGITFKPVFDNYGAYAMGVVTIDPNNHNVVWVGTGENNHQRALGYGDGVYKSLDGGKSWKNMGLKESRQIGGIVVDPHNSNIVFVAAEGSVWGPGGDRGLYKTNDGGKTWQKTLEISENTGVNNVVIDPSDSNILYLTTEQRRRHVFTKIGGGPESAVYKSEDNGESWRKLSSGLPSGDIGGMGIAVSPVNTDVVYLIVEAAGNTGGFYRSLDRGESWTKMSSYHSSGQYYNEIYCDPLNVDRVFSTETYSKVSLDGGKTWNNVGNNKRHVDDHALWIDPKDTNHFLIGGDGGVYETYDNAKNWLFKSNLPVTQFYRVQVDNDFPFYNVYGGTQDNNSFGGPSQNTSKAGVSSEEWYPILGGDGFWVQIDPDDPNIVYCEYQYGNMYRYDKKSGENLNIKPRPRKDEKSYKWNWDAPLIISPHSKTRLYSFANKVFRSDDRGDTWKVISGDLTSQVDRNTWSVMDHYWSVDAVAKNLSTSLWGTGVAFAESPVQEDLLYAGTDDGVLSVTEDGGVNWRQVKHFPGVPDFSYISDILPSKINSDVVYISFKNLKRDDFKPYVLKSTDKGLSWTSVSNNLPENGSVHSLEQDFVNENLLFAGTEFGLFFSVDAGQEWVQMKAGLPTIAIKDITIQKRENDLVLASFGRGFFILDDYSPLREIAQDKTILEKEAFVFHVQDALMYTQTGGKYGQGATLYHSKNPKFGAIFSYYLKDKPKTLREIRVEKEKELFKDKKVIPQPDENELQEEKEEVPAYLLFTVMDMDGNVVRKITQSPSKGINRINWDLRYDSPMPVRMKEAKYDPLSKVGFSGGMNCLPGKYMVSLEMVVRGELQNLVGSVEFNTLMLNNSNLPRKDRNEFFAFTKELNNLLRVMRGSYLLNNDNLKKVITMKQTVLASSSGNMKILKELTNIERAIKDVNMVFDGPEAKASWEELDEISMPLHRRMNAILYTSRESNYGVTTTMKNGYDILMEEFPPLLDKIKSLDEQIDAIERKLDAKSIQWTPDRLPKL